MVVQLPMASRNSRSGGSPFGAFLSDENGQATVEYILILSVAVVAAGAMARGIVGVLDRGVLRLGGQLEKDLKTGRMPLDIWK